MSVTNDTKISQHTAAETVSKSTEGKLENRKVTKETSTKIAYQEIFKIEPGKAVQNVATWGNFVDSARDGAVKTAAKVTLMVFVYLATGIIPALIAFTIASIMDHVTEHSKGGAIRTMNEFNKLLDQAVKFQNETGLEIDQAFERQELGSENRDTLTVEQRKAAADYIKAVKNVSANIAAIQNRTKVSDAELITQTLRLIDLGKIEKVLGNYGADGMHGKLAIQEAVVTQLSEQLIANYFARGIETRTFSAEAFTANIAEMNAASKGILSLNAAELLESFKMDDKYEALRTKAAKSMTSLESKIALLLSPRATVEDYKKTLKEANETLNDTKLFASLESKRKEMTALKGDLAKLLEKGPSVEGLAIAKGESHETIEKKFDAKAKIESEFTRLQGRIVAQMKKISDEIKEIEGKITTALDLVSLSGDKPAQFMAARLETFTSAVEQRNNIAHAIGADTVNYQWDITLIDQLNEISEKEMTLVDGLLAYRAYVALFINNGERLSHVEEVLKGEFVAKVFARMSDADAARITQEIIEEFSGATLSTEEKEPTALNARFEELIAEEAFSSKLINILIEKARKNEHLIGKDDDFEIQFNVEGVDNIASEGEGLRYEIV